VGEYQAIIAYLGVTFVVFVGAVFWVVYERWTKWRHESREYPKNQDQSHHPGTANGHA
jgi:hypothetical protein